MRTWRGLFPSSANHEHDLRMMEEALFGVYRDENDEELETFRSYFSRGPMPDRDSPYRRQNGASRPRPGQDNIAFEDDETPPPPPPIRTFPVKDVDSPAPPRVVPLLAVNGESTAPPSAAAADDNVDGDEEEDLVQDLGLDSAQLSEPASNGLDEPQSEAVDDDLLSLFEEADEVHTVLAAVRKAIPEVTIDALVAEARDIWTLLGAGTVSGEDAA